MRRTVRGAVGAGAAIVFALLLGGCGDDGDDGDDKESSGGAESAHSAKDPAHGKDLSGVWGSRSEVKDYTMVIVGDRVLMRWEDGPDGLCDGLVEHNEDTTNLVFQCANTPEGREEGVIENVTDTDFRVKWGSELDEPSIFAKMTEAPAKLPSAPEDLPGVG
ncbi:hypothetical protein IHE61_02280 [Streptomyces sp. GKU 257-1]|nr:hypothetical protein [Streptomyces sp. GKU 257-1]